MKAEEILQEIKHQPISFFIEKYIPLTKKGAQYEALCPFHQDSHPSLKVSDEKQVFKCFACNEAGDAISFIQKFKNISFMEALKEAGSYLGLSLEEKISYKPYWNFLEQLVYRYHEAGLKNENFLSFLKKRKLSLSTAKYFLMGFSEEGLVEKNSISQELGYHFGYREFFKNRFMIPIKFKNKYVGFTARSLENEQPKYLNSKESKIFKKRDILFHLEEAKSQQDFLILVEGHLDVASLYEQGIKQSCALMGLSFEPSLIHHFSSFKKIYFALDQDEPGKKFSLKLHDIFLQHQYLVRYLNPSPYKDLDEFLTQGGDLNKLLEQAPLYLDLLIEDLLIQKNSRLEDNLNLLKKIFLLLKPLGRDPFVLEKLLEVRDKLNLKMSEDALLNFQVEKSSFSKRVIASSQEELNSSERTFLKTFSLYPDLFLEELEVYTQEISSSLLSFAKNLQRLYLEGSLDLLKESLKTSLTLFQGKESWRNFVLKYIESRSNLTLDEKNRKKLSRDLLLELRKKRLVQERSFLLEQKPIALDQLQKINQEIQSLGKDT